MNLRMKLAAVMLCTLMGLSSYAEAKDAPKAAAGSRAGSTVSIDPESDAVFKAVRNLILQRDDVQVPLSTLNVWVKSKPKGYVRWGFQRTSTGDQLVMVAVSYRYDTGALADYTFVLGPINKQSPLQLMLGFKGETRLSKSDAAEVFDGFVLDMYHRGMVRFP